MWLFVPCPSAPASAASTSGWPAGVEVFASSSGTPSARAFSWPGWKKRPWIRLLTGIALGSVIDPDHEGNQGEREISGRSVCGLPGEVDVEDSGSPSPAEERSSLVLSDLHESSGERGPEEGPGSTPSPMPSVSIEVEGGDSCGLRWQVRVLRGDHSRVSSPGSCGRRGIGGAPHEVVTNSDQKRSQEVRLPSEVPASLPQLQQRDWLVRGLPACSEALSSAPESVDSRSLPPGRSVPTVSARSGTPSCPPRPHERSSSSRGER